MNWPIWLADPKGRKPHISAILVSERPDAVVFAWTIPVVLPAPQKPKRNPVWPS